MSPRYGLLATALLIGVCLRLVPVMDSTLQQLIGGGDAREYIQLAVFFADTDLWPPGNRFPGYSFLLMALFAILPFSHEAISLGASLVLSVASLGLLWILARRILGFDGGLIVVFLAAVHPVLVKNASRGLSEELFLVLFFVVLLLYLQARDRGSLSWQVTVGLSALACWMCVVRPDAAFAMVPLGGMLFWRDRHNGFLPALAKTVTIVAFSFLGPEASQAWMEGLGIQSLDARVGRAGLWMEFMIGRMPYSYAFYKETSVSEWIMGHHTILELVIMVIKSAVRQLLSLGVSLWSQVAVLIALLGAAHYGRDRRDWALPLAVPLAILPQWALMSLWSDHDVQRYNVRIVPLLLVFLVGGAHQLATWIAERRRITRFRDWLPAGVVALALLPALLPFSVYAVVRPSVDILMHEREQWLPKVSQAQEDLKTIWEQMIKEDITLAEAANNALDLRDRHDMYAPTYYVLGMVNLLQRDLPQAEAFFRRAIEINPFFAEAAVLLAEIDALHGRFDEAQKLMQTTGQLRPDYPLVPLLQGHLHMAANDLTQARSYYEKYVRLNTYQHRRALARERRILTKKGQSMAKLEAIEAAIDWHGSRLFSSEGLEASREASQVKGLEASQVTRELIPGTMSPLLWSYLGLDLGLKWAAPPPDDLLLYHYLGACAVRDRDRGAAERYWIAMTRTSPDFADSWANLGTLYATGGELDKARQLWLKARSLDPQNKAAVNGLGRLEAGRLDASTLQYTPVQIILPMTRSRL